MFFSVSLLKVVYTSTGDIKRAILRPSNRRELTQYEDGEGDPDKREASQTYYHYCDDCADAWDAVCAAGVPSVCDLVGYGSPLSTEASDAVDVMCTSFGDACAGLTGPEACAGQCGKYHGGDEGDGEDEGGRGEGGGEGGGRGRTVMLSAEHA